jgi:hypothetical protein
MYKKYGFECVTAGHIYDFNFLPRLKSIISNADVTMSNEIGTHIGYCIYMQKPHYYYKMKCKDIVSSKLEDVNPEISLVEDAKKRLKLAEHDNNTKTLQDIFGKYQEVISDNQYDIVNKLWGVDQIKSKQELLIIVKELDNDYNMLINNEI